MSDKSFGDHANRNIVKNPLLSTAVTGLSIEDLTHNAVLVPVAPNQGLITGSDQSGTYTQTLAHTDHDLANFPSGDSNSNILLPPQPSLSTYSYTLDRQTTPHHDGKPEISTSTVSKASAKSEDDFDVNEYFARLQGTRYVSAPLHSHQDPNANLVATEENLEEINLNDDKGAEVQQSLTADIAQNFSQLPNVLPHVASAVFSSFSNMWNMKSREQTPDDRTQSYQDLQFQRSQESGQFVSSQVSQSYQDVHFQGSQHSGVSQFHESQSLGVNVASVPLMSTEDVPKEVAPPPKEPPISGTSNFRLPSKKKYAQIPGLSTGESKPIAFNPVTQNVPSYFIPTAVTQEENKDTNKTEPVNAAAELKPHNVTENYNIFSPADTNIATSGSENQANVFMPMASQLKSVEETPPPPQINLQNQVPVIPPPPMFSTARRDSQPGKTVLPPSVARRIGSNHPVIKQQAVIQPPMVTGQIFVPTFDSTPTPLDPNVTPANEPTSQTTYSSQIFDPNISPAIPQSTTSVQPPNVPPQIPQASALPGPPKTNLPSSSQSAFASLSRSEPVKNTLPSDTPPTAPTIFNPSTQTATPAIFTPQPPAPASVSGPLPSNPATLFSQGPASLPPSSSIFSPPPSISQTVLPPGPTQPSIGSANIGPTLFTPSSSNIPPPPSVPTFVPTEQPPIAKPPPISNVQPKLFTPEITPPVVQKAEPSTEPPKPMTEPPKATGASNFRMTKKRPQYYAGPIEGIGSISNSIKPIIPTVDSGTFQGALFTPEQTQTDSTVSSFDITKQTATATSYAAYDTASQTAFDLNTTSYSGQQSTYPSYDVSQPAQDYGQQYNTAFDLSRPTTESYEHKEEPKESKGFGIIGSLKSKLSSIDINKIQNSVTTFFDPAYNDTKKDAPVAQDNVPYNAPQYQGHTSSNFEIFVPNVEQSQPYGYGYQMGQTAYGQSNPGYPSDFNYHHNQSTPYSDSNVAYQSYSTSYYSEPTQSLPQQQMNNVYTHETMAVPAYETVKSEESTAKYTASIETKEETNVVESIDNFKVAQNIQSTANLDTATKNENEYNLQPHIERKQGEEATNIVKDTPAVESKSEYVKTTGNVVGTISNFDFTQNNYTTVKDNVLSSFDMQNTSSFLNEPADNMDKEVQPDDVLKNTQQDATKKTELPKNDSILESLTKGEVPILGVSSVPLFGLSTIIPNKTEQKDELNVPLYDKTKGIDMLDRNASMSFFENFGKVDQRPDDVAKNIADSVSSFFEKPGLGLQDTFVPSASFFTSDQRFEESDTAQKVDLALDYKNSGLNEDVMLDRQDEKPGYKLGFEAFETKDDVLLDKEDNVLPDDTENVSELNICETCREVNKPDEKEIEKEDLTTQLIENITSPIQLANPVEVPLTEDVNAQRVEFDAGQFEEISHITEETIETIHVQTATELLEDDIKITNYGWSVNESFATNPPNQSDFNYTVQPNSISFYGDSLFRDNVPTNTSDELKTEYKHQEDLLPRQMSIPSAPPAEEDSKSDETGVLDVHSIELDAKEDFPIYEEFVIEPSETDDDKIEVQDTEKTKKNELDSFTNRVEKFKKMEEIGDVDEPKPTSFFELPSPPISMASYFDTGNYAADTHYRNTMTSPGHISIPPGFEEEFKKRLAIAKAIEGKTVPETQTQTKTTTSISFSTANTINMAHSIMPVGFNVEENVTSLVEETIEKVPLTTSVFTAGATKMSETLSSFGKTSHAVDDKAEIVPQVSSVFAAGSKVFEAPSNFDSVSNTVEEKYETFPRDAGDSQVLAPPSNFGNASNITEETPERVPQSSSVFPSSSTKMPELPSNFGSVSNVDHKPDFPQASSIFASVRAPTGFGNVIGDETEQIPQSSSIFATGGAKIPEVASKIGHMPKVTDDKMENIPQASSIFAFGDTKKINEASFGSNVSKIFEDKSEKLPPFSTIFTHQTAKIAEPPFGLTPASSESSRIPTAARDELKPEATKFGVDKTPDASNMFTFGDSQKPGPSYNIGDNAPIVDKKPEAPKLPDPINFFADTPAEAPAENFSRLASYFSSPPKTDHAKSFFELSQSQNHYRHAINENKYYDLMKDLTSVQNLAVPTDQTIRHVNYFTVEYDVVSPEFSKGDVTKERFETDDRDLDSLSNCRLCNNLIYDKNCKVKTAMNDNSEGRNTVPNMEPSGANRHSVSSILNFEGIQPSEEANEGVAGMTENRSSPEYTPVKHHWFYRVDVDEKSIWRGFSVTDSRALENAFLSAELNENTLVPTDGGRYDVNVVGRLRIPVYWSDKPTNVRRCSWFYKGTTDPRYVPYTEVVADKLEMEYHHGMTTGEWHRRLLLPNGEVVVMHGPNVMVHFINSDGFSTPPLFTFGKRVYRNPPQIRVSRDQPEKIDHLIFMVHGAGEYRIQKEKMDAIKQSSSRPRVVRRGHDESEIEDPEPSSIDHLLLLCHGVGSACDMRFRSVEEVVEDFRSTSLQLVQSHYKNSYDQGIVSRVEVLPISWHATLHSGETGVDRRLAQITLDSIPRLRSFTNDTVLDVLFYTSPVFCQTILDTVCRELNRIYRLFIKRNPSFKGGVSLGGHSLGSVILYDLLCHQTPLSTRREREGGAPEKTYVTGSAGTGQPFVHYPSLEFEPAAMYALGSPIAIFECIRGVETLGVDFKLPTCRNFFNIFHPYDPIAYRIEPLINPLLRDLKPDLIPHHKGRKRMHLELKDTMARVGADIKQKLLESLRSTWNKWKSQPTDGTLERVVEEELEREPLSDENKEDTAKEKELSTPAMLGRLNNGRRVDYVLQEAPLEMINEYLFAMSSHVGYWESEDTMLLMLREIYSALGIQPDSTVPQQSMTVQRTRISDTKIQVNAEYPSTSGNAP